MPEISWEEIAEEILFVFRSGAWPGARTRAFNIIHNTLPTRPWRLHVHVHLNCIGMMENDACMRWKHRKDGTLSSTLLSFPKLEIPNNLFMNLHYTGHKSSYRIGLEANKEVCARYRVSIESRVVFLMLEHNKPTWWLRYIYGKRYETLDWSPFSFNLAEEIMQQYLSIVQSL